MSRISHHLCVGGVLAAAALGLALPAEASSKDILAKAPSPRADDPVSPLTAFTVEGGQDATSASVKFGFEDNLIEGAGANAVGKFATYSISLSAPLSEKKDFTSPLTFDGLTNAAGIRLQFAQLVVPAAKYGANATTDEINNALGAVVLQYRGLFGKVSQKAYDFYDPVTLAKSDVTRTPWRVGGFYAFIRGDQSWSTTFEYAHEVAYRSADAKTVCRAGAGPLLDCVDGPIGRVQQTKKNVLSVEVRRSWGTKVLGVVTPRIGVAPKVAYETESDAWAVGLPVYLFGDKSGLTGGLRADWENKTHDLVVGVFLTKTFSISDGL
jgi:hypothetical protein